MITTVIILIVSVIIMLGEFDKYAILACHFTFIVGLDKLLEKQSTLWWLKTR